jgi:hypothetical protein
MRRSRAGRRSLSYAALNPFFRIIEEGLAGLVDDGHFFDLLAEDVIFTL